MRLVLLLAAALTLAAGCSSETPRARVHGTVKVQGVPAAGGVVVFIAADNMTYLGDIQPDGGYSVERVPFGAVKVSIQQPPPRASAPRSERPAAKGGVESKDAKRAAEPDPAEARTPGPAIPAKYAEQSKLAFDVTQADQEWSVDLTP